MSASLTLLADDLTGACDTGTLFAGVGAVPVSVWPRLGGEGRVRVADTESRTLAPAAAAARVTAAARALPADRYFKKIDSTLRGRIGAEVGALMAVTGTAAALLCPALPAQGRVVVDRVLRIHGTPVAETAVAADPEFPRLPLTARLGSPDVTELLRPQFDRPLAWIPLDHVRAPASLLTARLERLAGTVIVADAETQRDLDGLVEAALAASPGPLLVGAAGLARALAIRLGLLAPPVGLPASRRWLVVAGSRHPVTRGQVSVARAAGLCVIAAPESAAGDASDVARRLAFEAKEAIEKETFDLVVVTGGETAAALYEALGAEGLDLVGAPAPGLSLGYLRAPRHPRLAVLTKAGAFGGEDLLVELARKAAA